MPRDLKQRIANIIGKQPRQVSHLSGGCVAEVLKIDFPDGELIVAKLGADLELEARMLSYLRDYSDLPIPEVLYADDELLLMSYIPSGGSLTQKAEIHAADLLADLHAISAPKFGFDWNTLIGGLSQPNPYTSDWLSFFREQRLLFMGRRATDAGRLPTSVLTRLIELCDHLDRWIDSSAQPSLIHGDIWGGNVLCEMDQITGFVDPAIYYGDAEIELAFSTLFSTFGATFFSRYQEHRPLKPGFFEERRDIYNLYPLLVHVCLFGGSYVASVDTTLKRFGF